MANAINWFEIAVNDIDRAAKFYGEVLGGELQRMEMQGTKMAFFPMDGQGVSGALCQGELYKPTQDGALLYLNAGQDLTDHLKRVEKAGGTVLMSKTIITEEYGYMALFIDSEGNRIGLHSEK